MTDVHTGRLRGQRILFIHYDLEHGGAERQSVILGRYLRDTEGAQVEFAGFHPGSLATACQDEGILTRVIPFNWAQYTRLGRAGRLAEIWRLAGRLGEAEADVLVPYTDVPNFACGAAWLTGRTGARACIWNQRGIDTILGSSRWTSLVVSRVSLVVCNAEHLRSRFLGRYNVAPSRVHVVRNAVPVLTRKSQSRWRDRLGIPNSAWVACMPANLTAYKDHETVLGAWRRVATWASERGRVAILLLAGYFGPTANALKQLEYELELTPFVRFLGHVDDVQQLLAMSDICVFASASEGSPNGVLEAMAAGLPVAAADEPGVREALGAMADRQLVCRKDEPLAALIISLLGCPEDARALGTANQRWIQEMYSERRTVAAMADLLVQTLRPSK